MTTCRRMLVLLLLVLPAAQATLAPDQAEKIFAEANDRFRQANELRERDANAAFSLYQAAALRYERLIQEGGIRNGRVHYNLANAYFRMSDLGRAILHYRRAERLLPGDPDLQQSLSYVRSRRLDRFERSTGARVLQTLAFWHYDVSSAARLVGFAVVWALLWAALIRRRLLTKPWFGPEVGALAAASILLGASLIVEIAEQSADASAVIVAAQSTARRGDGVGYEEAFTDPLHAGAEVEILAERPAWTQIALPDARTAWVPAADVERISATDLK